MAPPLQEIERRVQDQAKDLVLDLSVDDNRAGLRSLIDTAIDDWRTEFKLGHRDVDIADPDGVARRAWHNLVGYGPLESLLADADVWEIMINAPDSIFVRRHRGQGGYHHEVFHDEDHVTRTLTKILDDASGSHRKLDHTEGLQDAQLDDGSRLHIVHGDLARGGHTMVNIRRFTNVTLRSLDQLTERDVMPPPVAGFLRTCVRAGASVLFSGAPGAGKTTLLTCCAAELEPTKRVVVAEEVFEIDVPLANTAHMQTRAARSDRPAIDLRRLVSGFLRMAPDVAIVGEVRDREALPLLLTLSSGVTGYTTIHAGSARQALTRLRFICQLAETSNELPMAALTNLVADSIDLVVHCERTEAGPRIREITAVEDPLGAESGTFTTTEVFSTDPATGALDWTGQMPGRLQERVRRSASGTDLRDALERASRQEVF